MLNPTIFREYDIRGIEELGRAIGSYIMRTGGESVNLARDCRLSSDRLRHALAQGILSTGLEIADVGVVPTPLLYFSVLHLKAPGGVMITGSHNPAEYNGFKVMVGKSTIHGEDIQHLLQLIKERDFEQGSGSLRNVDFIPAYVEQLTAQFAFDRRVKVVFDAGNGTAGPVLRRMIEKLNVDAVEMFFEMDGRFPNHHPDPTMPENLIQLADRVKAEGAELGIAFDGDSDRIGAVDERGATVYGDQLMIIYSREILSRKPGATIIGEVKCSQLMYDDIRSRGGRAIMWKTGHSLIKAKMQ